LVPSLLSSPESKQQILFDFKRKAIAILFID